MSVVYYYWSEDHFDWKRLDGSDYAANNNPFKTLAADGTITLNTIDDNLVASTNKIKLRPIHTVKVRVAYTADFVKDWFTERTVYDDFNVIFKEDCSDNKITLGTTIDPLLRIDDTEYAIGDATIPF